MGMNQLAGQGSFAHELPSPRSQLAVGVIHLEGELGVVERVVSQIDGAGGTLSELAPDLVFPDSVVHGCCPEACPDSQPLLKPQVWL